MRAMKLVLAVALSACFWLVFGAGKALADEISGAVVLTEDATYSDLNILEGATLDLNGHNLTINGKAFIAGTLAINGGRLTVNGDLVFKGKLIMDNAKDSIIANGDLSLYDSALTVGKLEVKGDFDVYSPFMPEGNHTMIFSGSSPQNVTFHCYPFRFRYLEIPNSEATFNPDLAEIGYYNLKDAPQLTSVAFSDGIALYPAFDPGETRYGVQAFCPRFTLSVAAASPGSTVSIDGTETDRVEIEPSSQGNRVVSVMVRQLNKYSMYFFDVTRGKHTVTFVALYGTFTRFFDYNEKVSTSDAPENDGYDFQGWYRDQDCTEPWDMDSCFSCDMTLYAKMTKKLYTIRFDSQGGSPVEPVYARYMTTAVPPPDPVRADYSFAGLFFDTTYQRQCYFLDYGITSDMTLYAKWIHNPFSVTFDTLGGSSVPGIQVGNSSYFKIWPMPEPTRAGSVFAGWYREKEYVHRWDSSIEVSSDMTLYACWAPVIPSGVKASSASYRSVRITWNPAPAACSYVGYRYLPEYHCFEDVGSTNSATTEFIDTGLKTGEKYTYVVCSCIEICKNKVISSLYSDYSTRVSAVPALGKAASLTNVPVSYNSIRITWTAVAGATRYELYRAISPNGTYKRLITTTKRSYTNGSLATGTKYYYKVKAYRLVSGKKIYGNWSVPASAKTKLGVPSTLKAARVSSKSIRLTWGALTGRSKYEIWCSNSANKAFKLAGATTSCRFTDIKLKTGQTYYYKVRAYHLEGSKKIYGGFSKVVSKKP